MTKKIILFGFWLSLTILTYAQPSNPPSPPGHGLNGNQGGGYSPLGSGLVTFIAMGAAYGSRKIYKEIKRKEGAGNNKS